MPKPTIFTTSIEGTERRLFSVQEQASGDLTVILRHSRFDNLGVEGAETTDADLLLEERFSIHRTPKNPSINAIKYTKIRGDGKCGYTRNYSTALKLHNCFAGILIRRTGDMSDAHYLVRRLMPLLPVRSTFCK
jgi:hypothetical protein